MRVLSLPAWGGEDPWGGEEGCDRAATFALCRKMRAGWCWEEARRGGRAKAGAICFSMVSWGGGSSPSQNSKRASYLLCFPPLPRDQTQIHLTVHKSLKEDVQETVAVKGLPGVLSCPCATSQCPTGWERGKTNRHFQVPRTPTSTSPAQLCLWPLPSSLQQAQSRAQLHGEDHLTIHRIRLAAPGMPRAHPGARTLHPHPIFSLRGAGELAHCYFCRGADRWECGLVAAKLTGFDVMVANR